MDGPPPGQRPDVPHLISAPGLNDATTMAAESAATDSAAADVLAAEIARLTRQGYTIVNRDATSAQLKRPKRFSLLWALFWLVVFPGGGIFVYLGWYLLVKRDRVAFLRITANHQVMLSES